MQLPCTAGLTIIVFKGIEFASATLTLTVNGNTMDTFIKKMPKAELNVHFTGTSEPELIFALAEKNRVTLAYRTPKALIEAYDFHDLPLFLSIHYAMMYVLLQEDDFYQLTYAYLVKTNSQNTLYAGVFFEPQTQASIGVSFDTVSTEIHKAQMVTLVGNAFEAAWIDDASKRGYLQKLKDYTVA